MRPIARSDQEDFPFMSGSDFSVEQAQLAEARHLPLPCHDEFLRLTRTLVYGPKFQWVLIDAPDERLRHQVEASLEIVLKRAGLSFNSLPLSAKIKDVPMLEARLVKNARQATVVHIFGRPDWFDVARWESFNIRRERLAAKARARLVFWLDGEAIALASRCAPDLWAWRSGVYAFLTDTIVVSEPSDWEETERGSHSNDPREVWTKKERNRRVVEIRAWLDRHADAPDELRITALNELGRLLFSLDAYDEALAHWRDDEIPFYRRLGDRRGEAITMGQIADVLRVRGQLDEALRIRKQEQLPVFKQFEDVRSIAITIGRVADILEARGELDEALRIRQDQELPVYEQLGDGRSKAVTMGKIADILQAHGQLDEALRIRQEEVLPVFENLDDELSWAITKGKIADILRVRGQLDEALRILNEDVLPVFEQLRDVRSWAVSMGKLADILQDRGQLYEALRIRKENQLPVFKKINDMYSIAITLSRIGDLVHRSGEPEEALRVYQQEVLPLQERIGDRRGQAFTKSKIADLLQAREA
jgi:tetratricopeptide (TPR) repeat protein